MLQLSILPAMFAQDHARAWDILSSACGVLYFTAWSASFYPQLILMHKRKSAVGLSADFTWINPLGFLALTIWSFGIYFSPIAREEYRLRHEGNNPQVSKSDLAFALHGFLLSSAQFVMVYYYTYFYRRTKTPIFSINQSSGEEDPLLPEREDPDLAITSQPTTPSLIFKFLIALAWVAAIGGGAFAKIGNFTFLDWLYLISTIKLIISIIKFVPQVLLNWRLQSSEGFSVAMPVLDLTGGVLSLLQLVISSVFIAHDPSGIIANPVKLGLSIQSIVFDLIFLVQKLYLYRDAKDPALEDEDETLGSSS